AAAISLYVLATWSDPYREAMIMLCAMSGIAGLAVLPLPRSRIACHSNVDQILLAWFLLNLGFCSILAMLDGGVDSPIMATFFVMVVYQALVQPTSKVVFVGACSLVAIVLIGVAGSEGMAA